MILTLVLYRFPALPAALHAVLLALWWAVALVAAVSLAVAVCMAVAPVLMQLAPAAAIISGYAMLTQPRKDVRA
jgi:hypothetical protein